MRDLFETFWKKNPLLFISINFVLGSLTNLTYNPYILIPLFFLLLSKKKKILALACFFFGFIYTACFHSLPTETEEGEGYFTISSLSTSSTFKYSFVYAGTLKTFVTKKGTYRNIPCTIYWNKSRPLANKSYYLKGKLSPVKGFFFFKAKSWQANKFSFSLAETRFNLKKQFNSYLQHNFKDKYVQKFFEAFVAGNLDDNYLKFAFYQTGLSHVLVISGLNFNITVWIFSLFIFFIPYPYKEIILLIAITLYFLFVGPAPSIERAYISISIALIGTIFSKKNFPLNAMGLALLIQTLLTPYSLLNIGLQLSYLCSASIILGVKATEKLFFFLKTRTISEIKTLSMLDIHTYLVSQYLKKSLALSLVVNLATIPLILFAFHKFPLSSFIYNLFFPQFTTLALFLFVLGFFLAPLPLLGPLVNSFNNLLTSATLSLIIYPPTALLSYLRLSTVPIFFVIIYLTILFFIGIVLYSKEEREPDIFKFV